MLKHLLREFISSPPLVVGTLIAAWETAGDQSWEGYAVAGVVALLRQFVSPVHDFRQ